MIPYKLYDTLSISEMLPVIREAFDSKSLQMFNAEAVCKYAGPCAIGVCLEPSVREELDTGELSENEYCISELFKHELFKCDERETRDLVELQNYHDLATVARHHRESHILNFELFLTRLEKKYRSGAEL